jgi:hypothetical protein
VGWDGAGGGEKEGRHHGVQGALKTELLADRDSCRCFASASSSHLLSGISNWPAAALDSTAPLISEGLNMFFVGEVVKPPGKGRTATWEGMVGTVIRVDGQSVFVQWHDCAVEEELESADRA